MKQEESEDATLPREAQPVTALSSAEAEVYAMMEAVKEARLRLWVAEEAGIQVSYPLTLTVDNSAGESFCKSTNGLSKRRGVYQMRESRIKELRDARIVTAKHDIVDTKLNLADRLTKGLSHVVRQHWTEEWARLEEDQLAGPELFRGHARSGNAYIKSSSSTGQ